MISRQSALWPLTLGGRPCSGMHPYLGIDTLGSSAHIFLLTFLGRAICYADNNRLGGCKLDLRHSCPDFGVSAVFVHMAPLLQKGWVLCCFYREYIVALVENLFSRHRGLIA